MRSNTHPDSNTDPGYTCSPLLSSLLVHISLYIFHKNTALQQNPCLISATSGFLMNPFLVASKTSESLVTNVWKSRFIFTG